MNYNLEKMLMTLGYTERGSKCIITRRKRALNLFIEDNSSVSEEDVVKILDTLSKKGIASMIRRMEEFLDQEEYSKGKGNKKVGIDKKSVKPEEIDNQEVLKESSYRVVKEEKGDIKNEKRKKVRKSKLLATKRDNLARVSKGIPLPAIQKRRSSKKHARFLR